MADVFRIPLTNTPQRFSITLSDIPLIVTCQYNNSAICWMIKLSNGNTEEDLTGFFPMVTGTDLLSQWRSILRIPGKLIVYTDGNEFAVPTLENLGVECNLYYVTDD